MAFSSALIKFYGVGYESFNLNLQIAVDVLRPI